MNQSKYTAYQLAQIIENACILGNLDPDNILPTVVKELIKKQCGEDPRTIRKYMNSIVEYEFFKRKPNGCFQINVIKKPLSNKQLLALQKKQIEQMRKKKANSQKE